jgi:PE-PPE domain
LSICRSLHRLRTPLSVFIILLAVLSIAFAGGAVSVALAATTAMVLGGAGQPDPRTIPTYIPGLVKHYFSFTSCQGAACTIVPTIAPQELFPFNGTLTLDQSLALSLPIVDKAFHAQLALSPSDHFILTGTSEGALVWALEKAKLANDPAAPPTDQVSFFFIANEARPNGGLLARFPGQSIPGLGITFGQSAPTHTGYQTIDVATQYDGYADFPRYPINLLADLNALAGIVYVHASDLAPAGTAMFGIPTSRSPFNGLTEQEFEQILHDPANRQVFGDTTYITIPTRDLPILQPLRDFGAFTHLTNFTTPVADLIEPALRVLIETGYDRTTPYGHRAPVGLIPPIDPIKLAGDLAGAGAEGVVHALTDFGLIPRQSVLTPAAGTTPSARSSKSDHELSVRDLKPRPQKGSWNASGSAKKPAPAVQAGSHQKKRTETPHRAGTKSSRGDAGSAHSFKGPRTPKHRS